MLAIGGVGGRAVLLVPALDNGGKAIPTGGDDEDWPGTVTFDPDKVFERVFAEDGDRDRAGGSTSGLGTDCDATSEVDEGGDCVGIFAAGADAGRVRRMGGAPGNLGDVDGTGTSLSVLANCAQCFLRLLKDFSLLWTVCDADLCPWIGSSVDEDDDLSWDSTEDLGVEFEELFGDDFFDPADEPPGDTFGVKLGEPFEADFFDPWLVLGYIVW